MQAAKKPAQIADFFRRQGLFDLGESGISKARERQLSGCAHCGHADQQGKDLGHGKSRGCLHGLRVKLQAATASGLGVNDKPLIAQGDDVAQHRPP